MPLREYHVVGRKVPTEADPSPQIFRMRIFAPSEVVAKSRFWCVAVVLRGLPGSYSYRQRFACPSMPGRAVPVTARR
jgi:hypothetical protein